MFMASNNTEKRSISLPIPVNQWLEAEAKRKSMSVSAFVAYLLMQKMEEA